MIQFKTKFKRNIACAVLGLAVGTASVGVYQTAYADPTYNPHCCGETILLGMILSLMNVNNALIYEYMISGASDAGTGIAGTLSANALSQASHNEVQGANQQSHYNAVTRARKAEMVAAQTLSSEIADSRECSEALISQQMGARSGSTDAASYSVQSASKIHAGLATAMASAPSESSSAGTLLKTHNAKYCSPVDVLNKRCSAGSAMPDGDVRVQSLLAPAIDFTSTSTQGQSMTMTPEQSQAALDSSVNIMGRFSPPVLPKAVSDSPAGRMYTTKYKIYEARLSPATMALAGIAGRRSEATLNAGAKQSWAAVNGEYSKLFPGAQAPANPSETELLRYEVTRRFAGSDYMAQLRKSSSLTNVLVDVAQGDAVELKILYEMHQRLEEDNAILSTVLAQLISPISKKEVIDASTGAYRSKQ